MSMAHILLGLLNGQALHGYELKHSHDQRIPGAKPLAYGQVYSTLKRLVRDDLAVEVGRERSGGPDRTTYEVTERGHQAVRDWLATVEPPAPYLSNVLMAKVVVTLLVSDEHTARHHLAAQRAAHLARMRELTEFKIAANASLADLLAADLAIAHLDADLRWMQTTTERITELRLEVHA
ncbi:PadR family transcriptional regulator [Streptomyces sp. NBC_00568]|uniref:PadR family transcriptional regulator n=1 Tax=Streptomyces sp. NBC_00568 TaxID=2975779 RepID=UPI00225A752C|nr:PadR family transcriptional regulator [Streptomyces sp. NBC_00568]MCX4993657.1 PadR family transcriptional regulator [Streptomyces sp. NBC_00568]